MTQRQTHAGTPLVEITLPGRGPLAAAAALGRDAGNHNRHVVSFRLPARSKWSDDNAAADRLQKNRSAALSPVTHGGLRIAGRK